MLAAGFTATDAYRAILIAYAALGLAMAAIFARVSPAIEASPATVTPDGIRLRLGLGRSRGIVTRLSALFALDAFGGGFVPQSLMAYWFHLRFGVEPAVLGAVFFGANLLAAVSSLSAARIAARIGLINTMVFTHLPSNVLLILVPLMPTLPLAVACLLLRYTLSQMDVPTRQSYVMAVVEPGERSAAAGVTGNRPDDGGGHLAGPLGAAGRQRRARRVAVLPRRRPEDRLRPAALPWVPVSAACAARAGRARLGLPSATARHAKPPPDEQQRARHDGDRDQQVERLEGMPDRDPVRTELHPGEHEEHRP